MSLRMEILKIPMIGLAGIIASYLITAEPVEIYRWVVLTVTLIGTLYQIYNTHQKNKK